jgi:hypothetical protein
MAMSTWAGKGIAIAGAVMALAWFFVALIISWVLWQFFGWPPISSLGFGLLIITLYVASVSAKSKHTRLTVVFVVLAILEALMVVYGFGLHP